MMPLPLRTAALLLATGGFAAAQANGWQIPARGAHVFQRTTEHFAITPSSQQLTARTVIADGHHTEPHVWRFFACEQETLPRGFEQPGFDASAWPSGPGGFHPDATTGNFHQPWPSHVLCLRTTCEFGRSRPKALWFEIDHDDGVRVWLNGKLLVQDDGCGPDRSYVITGKALDAVRRGENLIAVQCTDTGGARCLDLELRVFDKLPRGVRSTAELQAFVAERRQAVQMVAGKLFGPYRPPPMLLQGELDAESQHVAASPADLRDLAAWLATDVAVGPRGGALKRDAPRMWELGDMRCRGRAGTCDADGWQTLTVTLTSAREPQRGDDNQDFMIHSVLPFVHHAFTGELKIRRRLEASAAGVRVTAFDTDLRGTLFGGEERKQELAQLEQRERWQLQTTHQNRDTAFRLRVQQAIEKGTARLRTRLEHPDQGDIQKEAEAGTRSYQSGRLAIGLLALIKGGVAKDDAVLQRCLAELRQRTLVDTYSLGNAMMVLEAYHAPSAELGMLRDGSIDRPRRRSIPADDRALMQRWADRLLQNLDTRVDPTDLLRFGYVAEGRFDNSLEQYGLLGLYAAHLCGVELPPTVWEAAIRHLLQVQKHDGPRQPLQLMDYRSHARLSADPDAEVTVAQTIATARGWSYTDPRLGGVEAGTWGSMTCAGITGLAIAQAALLDATGPPRRKLQADADRARSDGFAWLARHLTVRYHPGAMTRQRRWLYYYLYSLERAALLSGVAWIQDRDWYFEGAMMLVLAQQDDGSWPGELHGDLAIERDAMAILFLKQSTTPVLTGK